MAIFVSPEYNIGKVIIRWYPLWKISANNCRTDTYIELMIFYIHLYLGGGGGGVNIYFKYGGLLLVNHILTF